MTGGPSSSNEVLIKALDAGNPLHLQTNNNSGFFINIKLIGFEDYKVWATAMKIALQARNKMGFVDGSCVNSIFEDLYLSQVYYENDVEFDILTKLTPCSCDAKAELGKHNQLMKLMQFLMGLDEVYQPIRSSLLTKTELPDVKDAFVIVCFEIIGYPNGFKKNSNGNFNNNNTKGNSNNNNRGGSSNNVEVQKMSGSLSFTNDQIAKLMSLIGEKGNSGVQANMAGENQHITNSTINMTDIIDISDLNISVGHLNGTIAKIRHVGNLRLTSNVVLFDVLVIHEYIDLKKEAVLGTSSKSGGLYMFDVDCKLPKIKSNFSVMCYHVSKSV
ncbi:ribonuclease H-like domain-containing protein [Tanacetum coccineum]